jgi:hypothetical protein
VAENLPAKIESDRENARGSTIAVNEVLLNPSEPEAMQAKDLLLGYTHRW